MENHWENIDDVQLFSLLSQDNEEAFEVIYRRHWKNLFNAAYKRLPDVNKCQDVVQNIFVDIWNRRKKLTVDKPIAFLYGAVRFQVFKAIEKDSKNAKFYEQFENEIISYSKADDIILKKEAETVFQLFLAALPKKRRKIFVMYHLEGVSTNHISQMLDVSEKTVRNQLSETTKLLKLKISHLLLLVLLVFLL